MRALRVLASVAAALVAALAGGSVAPALAVTGQTYFVDGCQSGTFSVLDGDTAILVYNDLGIGLGCTPPFESYTFSLNFPSVGSYEADGCLYITARAVRGYEGEPFSIVGAGGLTLLATADVSTIGEAAPGYCGDIPVAPQVPVSVPAWVQAYGRSSTHAPCIDGWDPSWAQWPNGGTGGYVCQRSIPSAG